MGDLEVRYRDAYKFWQIAARRREALSQEFGQAVQEATEAWSTLMELAALLPEDVAVKIAAEQWGTVP